MTLYGYGKLTPGSQVTTKSWTRSCDVGNTIVLVVQHQSSGNSVATVTDNAGNPWTKVASSLDYSTPGSAQGVIDMWVCTPTTAITTINFAASVATYWVVQAKDYAGAFTVRNGAKYYGASGSVCAVTATTGDTLVLGVAYPVTTGTPGTSEGSISGYTQDGVNNISTTQSEMWEKVATTTGTQTPNVNISHAVGVVHAAFYVPGVVAPNVAPTITAGSTQTMTSGTTANITYSGSDSDGTISSFQAPTVVSSADTPPTVGSPVYTGQNTANASVTFPVSGLSNGDHSFTTTTTDNSGALSPTATTRIIYTSLKPRRRSVTLTGVTMTSPSSGTAKDALNAWQANPYDLATNPTGVQPPTFATAGPPAAGAGITEVYQPLDSASVPPTFGQWWSASDTVTPITVYVDLKFGGVTKATQSVTLNTTNPVFVGRACTSGENTAIGADRTQPSVQSRFS